MKQIIIILLVSSVVFSCGSRKRYTTSSKQQTEYLRSRKFRHNKNETVNKTPETDTEVIPKVITNTSDYVKVYSSVAIEEMKLYHIPASITLAQGILESASGKGRLAIEANNHFGIKCHDWTGATVHHDDDADQECFRKYKDAKYSYRDHSLFLTERKRYSALFDLDIDDYKGWAKGLKAAGYATDRKYPDKLIALIERYELYNYDNQVTGKSTQSKYKPSKQDVHYVVKGDTLYSISRRYNISVQELQNINGLKDTNLSIGQELLVKS
ncbi:LysM peptidoglycan-binding domain-containing protein [Formosa sediminum]|uniref:Peptidoglycan hydrolase n=1 Tax=Formosa sediminum TaxID=2594004 RepID=A0A516GMI5_9FLAO|nr:glucosaminidase domain-containing protein [Formosa sediminum]QDO92727.1 LysM peptidoglycan-binding domain-containing protein [Formosa sediminum]